MINQTNISKATLLTSRRLQKSAIYFLLFAICLLGFNLEAQQAFSLEEAQDYGLKNSIQIKKDQIEIAKAKEQVKERVSIGLPQISANVNYTNYPSLPTSLIPAEFIGGNEGDFIEVEFGTKNNVSAKIDLYQKVFDGAYLVGVKAAKVYEDLTRSRAALSEQDIKYNIAKAYYTALIAREQERVTKKNIANIEKLHYETSEMNKQGFVEEIEVDRLQISLSNLQATLENAEKQTLLAHNLLKFQMNMPLENEIILTDSILGLLSEDDLLLDSDVDFMQRQEFKVLDVQKNINEINIKYMKSQYLPNLSLFATYEQAAQRNKFDFFKTGEDYPWFQTALVGIDLHIPIFDGRYKNAKVQQARLQLENIKLQEKETILALSLEAAQAKTDYQIAVKQIESRRENLELAQKVYAVTVTKYQEGIGSSLEVTDAERQLLQSQSHMVAALYDLLNAKTDLMKAAGKL